MRRLLMAVGVVAVLGTAGGFIGTRLAGSAKAADFDTYSAKFFCGTEPQPPGSPNSTRSDQENPVQGGNYATSINIHNPNYSQVTFYKKAVISYESDEGNTSGEQAFGTTKPTIVKATLNPDYVLQIDCNDIFTALKVPTNGGSQPNFAEGWVVLFIPESTPLDVHGVYTSYTFQPQENTTGTTCGPATAPTTCGPEPTGFSQQDELIQPNDESDEGS